MILPSCTTFLVHVATRLLFVSAPYAWHYSHWVSIASSDLLHHGIHFCCCCSVCCCWCCCCCCYVTAFCKRLPRDFSLIKSVSSFRMTYLATFLPYLYHDHATKQPSKMWRTKAMQTYSKTAGLLNKRCLSCFSTMLWIQSQITKHAFKCHTHAPEVTKIFLQWGLLSNWPYLHTVDTNPLNKCGVFTHPNSPHLIIWVCLWKWKSEAKCICIIEVQVQEIFSTLDEELKAFIVWW